MSAVPKTPYLSPEEYLARERVSEIRHEYFRGEVFAMSGASREHNVINTNLVRIVGTQLVGSPCEPYASDMRVKISPAGLYTYPDMVVACEEREFEDEQVDTLLNPRFLAEILSTTTENYNRGAKSAYYRQIKSLREYLLIAQDRVSVEHYSRQGGKWLVLDVSNLDETLVLESIGCRVPLRQLYDRILFPPTDLSAAS